MGQSKEVKTTGYISQPQSESKDIDVNQLAIMNINNVYYEIDGHVAKFILALIEDIDSCNERIKFLEKITGPNGES